MEKQIDAYYDNNQSILSEPNLVGYNCNGNFGVYGYLKQAKYLTVLLGNSWVVAFFFQVQGI